MQRRFGFLLAVAAWFGCLPAAAEFPQWVSLGVDLNLVSISTSAVDSGTVLVARGNLPALRSGDGGLTWSEFDVLGEKPIAFLPAPSDPNVFYALVGSTALAVDPPPRALYRSGDRGLTWQLMNPRVQTPDGQVIDYLSVGASADLLYGSRMVPTTCYTGSCGFDGVEGFMSTDGGRTWRRSDPDPTHYSHRTFPAASDAKVAYSVSLSGLYRTADQGSSWNLVLPNPSIYQQQVVVDNVDPLTAYVRINSIGTQLLVTEDGGVTWRTSDGVNVPGPLRNLVADPVQAGRVYFIGLEGEVFESRDRARTWHRVAPSSGGFVQVQGGRPVVGADGAKRIFYSIGFKGVKRLEIDDSSFTLGSDLWWNPAESGWGLALTQHSSGDLFGVWFTYDHDGAPVWRVMPGGVWNGRTFAAALYETRGPAYFTGPFDPSKVSLVRVGQATIDFADDNSATFTYRLDDGNGASTAVIRQVFGPPNDWQVTNFADMWWNPLESGWGLAVSHQFGNVFAVWFVYDDAGRPQWIVMPDSTYAYTLDSLMFPIYRGTVFMTHGPAAGTPFDPSKVTVTPVGAGAITFSSRNDGLSRLDVFGASVLKSISRQPF